MKTEEKTWLDGIQENKIPKYILLTGIYSEIDFKVLDTVYQIRNHFSKSRSYLRNAKDAYHQCLYREHHSESIYVKVETLAKITKLTEAQVNYSLKKWNILFGKDWWSKPSKEEITKMWHIAPKINPLRIPNLFRIKVEKKDLKHLILKQYEEKTGKSSKDLYLNDRANQYTLEEENAYNQFLENRKKGIEKRFMHKKQFIRERREKIQEAERKRKEQEEKWNLYLETIVNPMFDRIESLVFELFSEEFCSFVYKQDRYEGLEELYRYIQSLSDEGLIEFIENKKYLQFKDF